MDTSIVIVAQRREKGKEPVIKHTIVSLGVEDERAPYLSQLILILILIVTQIKWY